MVTGNREIIGEHVLMPDTVIFLPVATRVFINTAETYLGAKIFKVFARQFAGFTTGAATGINKKSILRCHGLLLKPSRSQPDWCAAGCLSPVVKGAEWSGY